MFSSDDGVLRSGFFDNPVTPFPCETALTADADVYAHWDAAYVLGCLSTAERREYEQHLGTCTSCRQAVHELADIPRLLSRLHHGDVVMFDDN